MNKKLKKPNFLHTKVHKESKKSFKNKTKPRVFAHQSLKGTYKTSAHESHSRMISSSSSEHVTRRGSDSKCFSSSSCSNSTDSEGGMNKNDKVLFVALGSTLKDGRYTIQKKLGSGAFSRVWLAWDKQRNAHVALKVQNCSQDCFEVAQDEIQIHKAIAASGKKDGREAIVTLLDHFCYNVSQHRKHVCMVFEWLGDNLLTLIKANKYRGLPLCLVKGIVKHILVGLNYLHNDLKIIHTDLKPENVLLTNPLDPCHHLRLYLDRENSSVVEKDKRIDTSHFLRRQKKVSNFGCTDKDSCKNYKHYNKHYDKNLQRLNLLQGGSQPLPPREASQVEHCANGCDQIPIVGAMLYEEQDERLAIDSDPDIARDGDMNGRRGTLLPNETNKYRQTTTKDLCVLPQDMDLDSCCKIVDLGSSCWTHKILTNDIQTRPYRCPEVVLGCNYSTEADMWSLGCIVFELATGSILFDPQTQGSGCNRDEDHLGQMMEVLGPIPKCLIKRGTNSHRYFTNHRKLKHRKLKGCFPMHKLLVSEHGFDEANAKDFVKFLLPLLELSPSKRPNAASCLDHPWLNGSNV